MRKGLLACALLAIIFTACTKDDAPTPVNPTPTDTTKTDTTQTNPVAKDGFRWKEDGGAEITADSAFWTKGGWGAGVRAYKGGMANFFEINFANDNTGTQNLDASFAFLKGNDTYGINAGTINITANANDKLTGTFTATVKGGSIAKVDGMFTNLPKR